MGWADAGEGPEDGQGQPGDDARFADLPRVKVTVPDDARELDADVRAYHRELRRRSLDPSTATPPQPAPAPDIKRGGRMFAGVFALLLIIASVALMISPRHSHAPARPPLANVAGASTVGLGNGLLLPDIKVRVGDVERSLHDLRPAVIALIPADCSCADDLQAIYDEVEIGYQYELFFAEGLSAYTPSPTEPPPLGTAEAHEALLRLARDFAGMVPVLQDPSGRLAGGFSSGGLQLVLVAADGIVTDLVAGTEDRMSLDLKLAPLRDPAPAATLSAGHPSART